MDEFENPYSVWAQKRGMQAYNPEAPRAISGPSEADLATSGAAGAAMGGPLTAGIMVGGQFLQQYMAQKAADERHKREMMAQAAQNQSQGERGAISSYMNNLKYALSRS